MTETEFPLLIGSQIRVEEHEVTLSAIRAQGAGGQNVNKVATAIHLRFDIHDSSLPERVKEKLAALNDQRISSDGVIVIKAQRYRTQEQNRADALSRLVEIIRGALHEPKKRKPTRPTRAAKAKRVDTKVKKGKIKSLRGKVKID